MKATKKLLAVFLAVIMLIGTFSIAFTASAATKKVTSVKLNKTSATLYLKDTLTLTATVSPSNASNKSVTWSTSNKSVATVSSKGVVTPKKTGTVTITAKAKDGSGKKATCKVTVKKPTLITSMKLNASSKTVYKGQTYQLKVSTVKPSNASIKKYTWKSSNTKVATVSSSGVVKGVKAGTATITATAKDGSGKKATCKVTIKNPVLIKTIKLNATSKSISKGSTYQLKVSSVTPSNASIKKYTWSSSNTKVAKVSSSGKVTAVKAGTATITCKATDGSGKKATCKITVKGTVSVTSVKLNASSKTVYKGQTYQLKATVSPSNATNSAVTWSTSNKSVATVSSSGLVKGVKAGTATITATAKDGSGKKATCKVTIKNPVLITKITLNKTSGSIYSGKTLQLSVKSVTPSNASIKKYTWSSSNTSVAKVSSSGLVTGVKGGTATITCKATDGSGKTATCKVTVRQSVTKVALSSTSLSLSTGGTSTLKATVTPSNAYNSKVTWKSSKTSVATVSSSGKVTAVAAGSATITCTAADGSGVKATCKVTVKDVTATSVKLSSSSATIYPGSSLTLTATVSPSNTTNKAVSWTSSDTAVATVDSNGTVRGVKSGTTTITATTKDGSKKKATCTVTVGTKVSSISITGPENDNENFWYVGKTGKLTATVSPSNATNAAVTWSSSNTSYATVDANGNVTAKACGKILGIAYDTDVTITATAKDGSGVKATYKFTIKTKKTNVDTVLAVPNDSSGIWYIGESYTIRYSFGNTVPSNQGVTFTSSDPSIATIDSRGKVTILKTGSVTFTVASTDNPAKKDTVSVVIYEPSITSYVLDNKDYRVGSTISLYSSLSPYRLTEHYGQLRYESENTNVAIIVPSSSTATANITFVGAGSTRVRAMTNDGKIVGNWVTVRAKDLVIEQDFFDGVQIGNSYKINAYVSNGTRLDDEIEVFLIGNSQYYLDYDVDTKEIYVISDLPAGGVSIRVMTKDGVYSKDIYFVPNKYDLPSGDTATLLSRMKQYDNALHNLTTATLTRTTSFEDTKVDSSKSSVSLEARIGIVPIDLSSFMEDDDFSPETLIKDMYVGSDTSQSAATKDDYPAKMTLEAADVKNIEVVDNGSRYYTMKLNLNKSAEGMAIASVSSTPYAKAMPVIDQPFLDNYIKQFNVLNDVGSGDEMITLDQISAGTVKQTYSGGYVTFTIDKVTDKVTKSEYHFNSFVDVSNAKLNMSASLEIEEEGGGLLGEILKTMFTATIKVTGYFTMNVDKTLTFDNITY